MTDKTKKEQDKQTSNVGFLAGMPLETPVSDKNGVEFDFYKVRVKTGALMQRLNDGENPFVVMTNLPADIVDKIEGIDLDIMDSVLEDFWSVDKNLVKEKKLQNMVKYQ